MGGGGGGILGGAQKLAGSVFGGGGKAGLFGTGARSTDDVHVDQSVREDKNYDAKQKETKERLAGVDKRNNNAFNASAAQINTKPQEQFRNDERANVAALQAQADGTGPSLAQNQLKRGTDRNLSQIMAQQASAGGSGAGASMRNIARNSAAAQQQAAGQSADTRLQEQMAARQQLAQAIQSGRAADTSLATNQANLQQQTALANQQMAAGQQAQKDAMTQYYLNRGMNLDEANRQAAIQVEGLKVGVATGNRNVQELENQRAQKATSDMTSGIMSGIAGMSDGTLKTEAKPIGATMGPTEPKKDESFADALKEKTKKFLEGMHSKDKDEEDKNKALQSSQTKSGEAIGSGIRKMFSSAPAASDATATSSENEKTDTVEIKTDVPEATEVSDTKAETAKAPVAAAASSEAPQSKGDGKDSSQSKIGEALGGGGLMKSLMGGMGGGEGGGGGGGDMMSSIMKMAPMAMAAMSDETSKKDKKEIKDEVENGDEASDFLNAIKGFTYKYKDPTKYGEGMNMGIMAQDLAKAGPIGKSMVMHGPDGKLMVDYGKGFGAMMAAVASINEKLNELEKKKGKK